MLVPFRLAVRWMMGAALAAALLASPARGADTVAPGAVGDLAFASSDAPGLDFDPETGTLGGAPLVFTWTAPGDDGDAGRAWRYEVRLIRGRLDEASWMRAEPVAEPVDLPLPSQAGTMEVLAFTEFAGLAPGVHYEIGLKAVDEAGNRGPLSNVAGFDTPGETVSWSERVDVGGLEVWAWGTKLAGPEIACRYENAALALDGHTRPYVPEELPAPPNLAPYESVPMVRELLDDGVILEEAVPRYLRERRAFLGEIARIGRIEGLEAAEARLESSALVDTVHQVAGLGAFVILRGEGKRTEILWADDEPGLPSFRLHAESTTPDQARAAVDWLKTVAENAGDPAGIVVFARAGMMHLIGRRDLRSFRDQVEHLERRGRLENLPPGPLSDGPAREFLLAARFYGE